MTVFKHALSASALLSAVAFTAPATAGIVHDFEELFHHHNTTALHQDFKAFVSEATKVEKTIASHLSDVEKLPGKTLAVLSEIQGVLGKFSAGKDALVKLLEALDPAHAAQIEAANNAINNVEHTINGDLSKATDIVNETDAEIHQVDSIIHTVASAATPAAEATPAPEKTEL